jgi:hypothetical protein
MDMNGAIHFAPTPKQTTQRQMNFSRTPINARHPRQYFNRLIWLIINQVI